MCPDYQVPRLAKPGETIRQIEAALARMGHLASPDQGRNFTLRRMA